MSEPTERKTWTLAELAAETGVAPRTIRHYLARGLLPPVELHGARTVYGREHWLRLLAVRNHVKEYRSLLLAREDLRRASTAELERLAGIAPEPAPAPPEPAPPEAAEIAAPSPAAAVEDGDGAPSGERWERFALLPGLELHLRGDATPIVRHLAREIHERYGATRTG